MAVRSGQHTAVASGRTGQALYPRTRRIRFHFGEKAGRKYFVAGDIDTAALALQWRDTLFGADGVLVDHLR